MTPTPRLLTTGEASRYTGIPGSTLRRWAKVGRLRHVELPSGRLRFLERDLDEVLRPTEVANTA
jgi:excisionase family DNA binding protein